MQQKWPETECKDRINTQCKDQINTECKDRINTQCKDCLIQNVKTESIRNVKTESIHSCRFKLQRGVREAAQVADKHRESHTLLCHEFIFRRTYLPWTPWTHFQVTRAEVMTRGERAEKWNIGRVGQNHIYTVHMRCFWQGNHQIYGHIRCIYTVLANPKYRGSSGV